MTEEKTKDKKPIKKWITWGICAIPILALISFIIIFPRSLSQNLFLEYFSLLFSIPGSVIIVGLVFLLGYKSAITFFIRERAFKVKTKAGTLEVLPQSEKIIIEQDEYKKEVNKKDEPLRVKYAIEMAWFERTIRYMYKSQYRYLKQLQSAPTRLMTASMYWGEYIIAGGTRDYSLKKYMDWLINWAQVISYDAVEGTYFLNDNGKAFLSHCESLGYSELEFRSI